MINIYDKKECCGCSACAQRCPKDSITMQQDETGFFYPKVDHTTCINCGLCEIVCPELKPYEKRKPILIQAATNKNEYIRLRSSSGGIFSLLAEDIINKGGVVFGVRFDANWQATLDHTETIEGLSAFRGSKYVQARISETYNLCEHFLKNGRNVMFSGTPCQIAGLKHFLRKEYDKLLTVEIFCHGVPSPLVWQNYIEEVIKSANTTLKKKNTISSSLNPKSSINDIRFRDKSKGWKKYHFVLSLNEPSSDAKKSSNSKVLINECFDRNIYMRAFLKNLSLRPSCFACRAKAGSSGCDISLGDFWGYSSFHQDDDKGTSAVLTYTTKGNKILKQLKASFIPETYNHVLAENPAIEQSVAIPKAYHLFWDMYPNGGLNNIDHVLSKYPPTFAERLSYFIKHRVFRIKE